MLVRRASDTGLGISSTRKGGGKEKIFDIDDASPTPAQVRELCVFVLGPRSLTAATFPLSMSMCI